MQRILSIILGSCIMITILTSTTVNAKTIAGGSFGDSGDNVKWSIDEYGKLTISGSGNMKDYNVYENRPWDVFLVDGIVKCIEVSKGVTSICDYAFQNERHNHGISKMYNPKLTIHFEENNNEDNENSGSGNKENDDLMPQERKLFPNGVDKYNIYYGISWKYEWQDLFYILHLCGVCRRFQRL